MRPVSPAMAEYCRNTLRYAHSLFRGEAPVIGNPLTRVSAVEAVAAAALATFPNTATSTEVRGGNAAAPAAVRRALQFMEAHVAEPLGLADIARAAGIGPRALQEAFRRHRETTPMNHLRELRLERAHRQLQASDPTLGDTVAGIAARWGFAHPGRFASAYRRTFGRSPSQTLLS
jgi:transcriptional regulator GlxA family with amidase domain